MEEKLINKDKEFEDLISKWKELSFTVAVISAAIQYKKSREIISKKIDSEKVAITFGINSINKKVLENLNKYDQIENDINDLINRIETNLQELSVQLDCLIINEYTKIVEEEKNEIEKTKEVYELIKEEVKAKTKADNSDDEIREKICDIEDEISKSELKIRRLKPIIKKKIEEKEMNLSKAMETKEQQLQRNVKGPRVFSKATRFFLGKINPYKTIQKNVFLKIRNRIELYENEERPKLKKINDKFREENVVVTIKEIIDGKQEIKIIEKTKPKKNTRKKKKK